MPRLGQKYPFDVEVIAKSREAYQAEAYVASDLPAAPAVMVGDDIVVEGADVTEAQLEAVIRRHLGLPPQQPEPKGFLKRLFGK